MMHSGSSDLTPSNLADLTPGEVVAETEHVETTRETQDDADEEDPAGAETAHVETTTEEQDDNDEDKPNTQDQAVEDPLPVRFWKAWPR